MKEIAPYVYMQSRADWSVIYNHSWAETLNWTTVFVWVDVQECNWFIVKPVSPLPPIGGVYTPSTC